MRRILAVILLIVIAVGGFLYFKLTRQTVADKDGNPLRYSFQELDEKGVTGVFVHNEDGTFSPCIHNMPNFEGPTEEQSASRFLWYVESDESIGNFIPMVTDNNELVVIYNMDGDLPESYYLEKYALRGYTIGAHIYIDEEKTLTLSAEDSLEGSQASAMLNKMEANTDDEYIISEISGSDVLPINNVDPNMGLLLGLQKNKLYRIRYYQGTKAREATFRADTKVFQSQKYIPISTPYKKTNKGYFVVNLPQNLSNGYYYLSDIGFFALNR